LPPLCSLSLPQSLHLEADANPRPELVGARVDQRQRRRLPSIVSLPLCSFPEHARSTTAMPDLMLPCVFAGEAEENDTVAIDS
jgi:hypothetical protein